MNDTDTRYLQMMIEHHRAAVTMSQQYLTTAGPAADPRAAALARNIITAQTSEIARMTSWLGETALGDLLNRSTPRMSM